jgi:predicted ATPase
VAKIRQLPSPTGEPLQLRVGVATGLAFVSQMQAIGGPSALAVRVCQLATPNSVLVIASTRRLLSSAFVCENPERYALAGVSVEVSACRVTGKRAVESRFKSKHSDKITRLVGRDQELQRLLALWDRAKRGEGQVGLICGEAGIGKSHLCEFLLKHIMAEPHGTIRYQCSPRHLNSPFYPVISQLEHAMGFEQTDTPEVKLEKLEAALSQAVEATQEDVSLYAGLLTIVTPEREASPGSTPQRQRARTLAALIQHLLGIAGKQPLVIMLADAHWVDSSTLELVDRIIPLIKTARILFLIKFRPEFIPQWLGEPHVTMLRLGRMGREQSLVIISEVTGGKKLRQEVQEQIIAKTDGVPLYIEELTKTVVESELVQDVGYRDVAAGPLPYLAVPATLLDSLTARLDRLGRAKEVAQIGAALGRSFSHELVSAAAQMPQQQMDSGLAELVTAELIFRRGMPPDAE